VALTIAARTTGFATFHTYPQLRAPGGAAEPLALVAAYALVALLPFADRRGIER
jgi:hypothetical protein